MRLEWDSRIHEANKEEDRELLHTRINRFYASVRKKLQSLLNHDNRVHRNHHHELHNLDKDKRTHILALQNQASGDRKHMQQVLQRAFNNSAEDDTFALSVVYHELLGNVSRWEEVFARILGVTSSAVGNGVGSASGLGSNVNQNGTGKPIDILPTPGQSKDTPILGSSPSQEAMITYLKAQTSLSVSHDVC